MIAFLTAAMLASTPGTALLTTTDGGARPQVEAPARTAKPKKETRYCVEGSLTGTRIPLRECHTRSEWLSLGFDPLEKQ
ncbi:hypothetical protein [Sphingomonas sp.]|jgi:hypothetical protein|uniref:hypothetical protein n=1 Tax=Sphingomonas sp. TaxID=28214 RepID=UPI002D7ED3F8|nr:hypothetical protein [Sphingomonas sp.]HEU0045206.1 hypothetical protein [Sphingomonas sp.]